MISSPTCVRVTIQGSGFRVQGSGFRVQGSGFMAQDLAFTVQGSEAGSYLRLIDFCMYRHAPREHHRRG